MFLRSATAGEKCDHCGNTSPLGVVTCECCDVAYCCCDDDDCPDRGLCPHCAENARVGAIVQLCNEND